MKRRLDIRFVLGVLLGLVLTVWFFGTVHWGELGSALLTVSLPWTALAAGLLLCEFALRSVRWRLLLHHVDPGVGLRSLFSALVIGAALNTLLPLRGGDLIRPAVLARERGLPYATVLTTTVVERVLDIAGLLGVLGVTLVVVPAELAEEPMVAAFRATAFVLVVVGATALFTAAVLASRNARRWVLVLLGPAPARVRTTLLRFHDQLAAGFSVVGRPWRLLAALGVTAVMWSNGLLAILVLFQAFHLELGVVAGLFTQCGLAAVVALPQAPGYWGAFQVAVTTTLELFGTGGAFARASAILFWAVSFVPVTILGLFEYWRYGRALLRTTEVADTPVVAASEEPA